MPVGEDTIPLFAAAAIAYEQVSSMRRTEGVMPSVDELDLVALALSNEELTRGMFWGGGTRFELGGGLPTFTQLVVRKSDLARVLDQLKRRPLNL